MYIRKKLFISFLLVVIIPVLFLSYLFFVNTRESLKTEEFKRLKDTADLKVKRIESIFSGLKEDILVSQGFYNIKLNLPILIHFRNDRTNPAFIKARDTLFDQLKVMVKNKGLLDIRLTDLEGKIVYAVDKKHLEMEEGKVIPYYSKEISREWQKGIWVSDIFKHAYHLAMLITAPAYNLGGKVSGFIVFEVDMQPIYEIIQDTTGLGETGETLIAKKITDGAIYLNTLRHDKEAALKRRVAFGARFGLPVLEAVQGRNGSGISTDYRGKKVIAAWRYMPSLGWGVVAKIDTQEAFASIEQMRRLAILLTVIAMILTAILSFLIAKSISGPIHRLHKGTEIIGSGNLDYKVGIATHDEIGQLSRAFDEMARNLKDITASRDELNRAISQRKQAQEELKKANAKLENLAITDELTSLYNRRGFREFSKQGLKIAKRNLLNVSLLFIDIDRLKHINDSMGHPEGDKALITIATVIKNTCRESDIVARIGGDEFAILALGLDEEGSHSLISRLQHILNDYNKMAARSYNVSMSIGVVTCTHAEVCPIDALLTRADKLMYEKKREKTDSA